jgi:hypothetical protein
MAETPKVLSALLAQLPDNTNEEISPEDLRDAVVSLWPSRGQLDYVAGGTTTFAASGTWTKLALTTVLDTAVCSSCISMPGNNEMRLLKAVAQVVLVTATVEVTSPSNNKTYSACIAKNGVALNTCHVTQKIESAGAAYTFVVTALVPTVQDDTLSIYVRNDTDTTALTTANYTLSAVGFVQ